MLNFFQFLIDIGSEIVEAIMIIVDILSNMAMDLFRLILMLPTLLEQMTSVIGFTSPLIALPLMMMVSVSVVYLVIGR